MPWWMWVLIALGVTGFLFGWTMARIAALADHRAAQAHAEYVRDPKNWTQARWNRETEKIINDLKREAREQKEKDA